MRKRTFARLAGAVMALLMARHAAAADGEITQNPVAPQSIAMTASATLDEWLRAPSNDWLVAELGGGQLKPATVRETLTVAFLTGSLHSRDSYWKNYDFDVLGMFGFNYKWPSQSQSATHALPVEFQGGGGTGSSKWARAFVANFDYLHTGFGSIIGFGGGLRFVNTSNADRMFFVQVRGGIEHDEFETAPAVYPGVGVMIPMKGKPYVLEAGLDYSLVFYDGFTSKGPGFYGGIGIPFGGK